MNGDLGNLLTGEMGEAESRFAYDDFAEAYGRRVMGRVRRRRTVRAVGVGGGTMLTAGALVVGATHMPWGVLGAAPGMGGSDCVTPSPSDGAHPVTVTFDTSGRSSALMNVTDPVTGSVRLIGIEQAGHTWVFTDAEGNPVAATRGGDGSYFVQLSDPAAGVVMSMPSIIGPPSDPTTTGSVTYTYTAGAPNRVASPSASDDCYTPSPTPSPTPSSAPSLTRDPVPITELRGHLTAKDVTSPFQCGFEFPTDSYRTGDLWIDGLTWTTADEINAQMKQKFAGHEQDIWATASGTARIPIVDVSDRIGAVLGLDSYQVSRATVDPRVVQASLAPLNPGDPPLPFEGFTFVAVTDHKVVGTIDPAHPVEKLPTLGPNTDAHAISEEQTLLNSEDPFTACPGITLGNAVDFYAIAGTIAFDSTGVIYEPTYVWLNIGKP